MGDDTPSENSATGDRNKEITLKRLISSRTVKKEDTIRAYRVVPRELFLPEKFVADAYVDSPLPIGEGQTISAIHMCLIYLELLELREGLKVLEVGGGSGYHAALVAEIVSPTGKPPTGHVFSIERKPSLVEFAKANLERAGYDDRVTVIEGDGTLGLPAEAPFDRIMVAAAAPDIPPSLIDQLKPEGIMIIPVGRQHFWQELTVVTKDAKGEATKRRKMSVAFVPLIGEEGWSH